jgi:predicted nuclease of restriction endonuclease-like (RecB) superfamily
MTKKLLPHGYADLLDKLKQRIRAAQVRAAVSVNSEMILLYWHVGSDILKKQDADGWGSKVIDMLSADLRREFPAMKGVSHRNLKYMRAFAKAWPEKQIVQEVLAQIAWYQNIAIIEKLKDTEKRLWYARHTLEHGWSRNVLVHQIESDLFAREGAATTNFHRTLPPQQSDLAQQTLKDPYCFDFLTLDKEAHERDLEQGLVGHIRDFLVELGVGFAFVGRQVHLVVDDRDFFIDLLFYHIKLRCFVVIELKAEEFKPEFAGKLNFYLSAVDDQLRHKDDKPTIGIILCKTKSKVIAEYALRDMKKPMGVSAFETKLTEFLPKALKGALPEVEELESELAALSADSEEE